MENEKEWTKVRNVKRNEVRNRKSRLERKNKKKEN